jgi:hypothetical protein
MTMGWPNSSASLGATKRAMLSIRPPGGKGTTSLMGRVGQAWASADEAIKGEAMAKAVAATSQFLRCMGCFLM